VASGVLLKKTAIGAPVAADIARMAGAASPAAGRLGTRVIHGAGAAVYGETESALAPEDPMTPARYLPATLVAVLAATASACAGGGPSATPVTTATSLTTGRRQHGGGPTPAASPTRRSPADT
jgi:hypothetical protein